MQSRLKLILVESRDDEAFLLTRMLANAPDVEFEISRVISAREASDLLEEGRYDGLILDLEDPQESGIETLLKLRNLSPQLAILVLTEHEDEDFGMKIVECGAQDFIGKDLINGQLLFRSIRYAIARQRQITHFKAAAHTDALTGLANRRGLDKKLSESLQASKLQHESFAFMLLDIDNFKHFNDEYGHRVGDFVLSRLAGLIQSIVPEGSFCARYGGEELAVLMPRLSVKSGEAAMKNTLRSIASHPFELDGHCHLVTVSGGLTFAIEGDLSNSVIERADNALYQAKRNGRNRGEVHISVEPTSIF